MSKGVEQAGRLTWFLSWDLRSQSYTATKGQVTKGCDVKASGWEFVAHPEVSGH